MGISVPGDGELVLVAGVDDVVLWTIHQLFTTIKKIMTKEPPPPYPGDLPHLPSLIS